MAGVELHREGDANGCKRPEDQAESPNDSDESENDEHDSEESKDVVHRRWTCGRFSGAAAASGRFYR